MYNNPTIADFKNFFVRDFPYGLNISENILDADISRAQTEATLKINQSLFPTQEEYDLANNYLSAHMLVLNIRESGQGLASQYAWMLNSKSVGSISLSQSVPSEISESVYYSFYSSSSYGIKYLMNVWPLLTGVMYSMEGATQP